jgi:hypothetical protein
MQQRFCCWRWSRFSVEICNLHEIKTWPLVFCSGEIKIYQIPGDRCGFILCDMLKAKRMYCASSPIEIYRIT